MRSCFLVVLLVLHGLAGPAQAGAWLREQGTSFTSISFSTTWFRDTANASYVEYGLRDDMTIGADVSYATNRHGVPHGYATLFLRRPLSTPDASSKWAYEIGIGASWFADTVTPHVQTGLSWGRGFQLRGKGGWMAVDAKIRLDTGGDQHVAKIDSTVGINFTEETTGMLQLYVSHLDGETFGSIAPSILIKPRRGKYRFQIGTDTPFENAGNTAIKLGLWREF